MINFSINKTLFLQALNTTKRAISSKNAIPILSTIKIDVTPEGVALSGSKLERPRHAADQLARRVGLRRHGRH